MIVRCADCSWTGEKSAMKDDYRLHQLVCPTCGSPNVDKVDERCDRCGGLFSEDENCRCCKGTSKVKEPSFRDASTLIDRDCSECRNAPGKSHSCEESLRRRLVRLKPLLSKAFEAISVSSGHDLLLCDIETALAELTHAER